MTIKEREQIIKELQEVVDNYSGSWKRFNVLDNTLTLIKELTEEIKDLEEEYDRVYEQAEADILGNMADGGTSCHWCIAGHRADAVKEMQNELKKTFSAICKGEMDDLHRIIDVVASNVLEENK